MNEDRLPQWIPWSGSGSPRRVAQFDDELRPATTTTTTSSWTKPHRPPAYPTNNPFVSSSSDYAQTREFIQDFVQTNLLTMYCRQGLWEQALERAESHPHEAKPNAMQSEDFFHELWSNEKESTPLYETSPLGILCNSKELDQVASSVQTILALVQALGQHGQVAWSQKTAGTTPLVQAIQNPTMPPAVLEALLRLPGALQALQQPDSHGVYPLDHVLQHARKFQTTRLLEQFLNHAPLQAFHNLSYSPLVRFYSTISTAGGGLPSFLRQYHPQLAVPTLEQSHPPNTIIAEASRLLLQALPALLTIPSPNTGCMPIHAALRNFGNQPALLQVLFCSGLDNAGLLHRNHFGDLPLHVACACGVPLSVLRLVLARTVQVGGAHAMLWSTNHAGYTPIDLEWIRHIEAGNGFLSQAVFQPIGVEGIPRPRGRYNDLYDKLLRQAVVQVIQSKRRDDAHPTTTESSPLGLLLHRIFLIIRATFQDSFSTSPFDLSGDILHQAAALFQPCGPSVPEAIMDLLLWQYPEQVEQRDHLGRTPLHHVVSCTNRQSACESKCVAWERWIHKLLAKSPLNLTLFVDTRGRYPLHTALDRGPSTTLDNRVAIPQYHTVVLALAQGAPETLQTRDPISRLFPVHQAASHPFVPLDTVYWLLRRAPGVIG